MKNESRSTIRTWMSRLGISKNSTKPSANRVLSFPQPMPHTQQYSVGSTPSTDDSTESKESSTTETGVEPGDAPVAIDSPRAVLSKQDMRNAQHSQAVINVEKIGPWLIVLTAVSAIALTIIVMMLIFGERYMDAKIQAAVAQAETRIRTDVAKDAAEAKAVAHAAETHGRLALAGVDRAEVELNKRGIKISLSDH